MNNCVNFGYPQQEEPIHYLQSAGFSLPPDVQLDDWQPDIFATLSGNFGSTALLSAFVDRLLVKLHDLEPHSYGVDVQFENL